MIKRIFLFLGAAAILILSGACVGRGPVHIDTIEIGLWPEFDRPSMLVIYRIMLSEDTSLPARLTFRIPTRAGQPHAVADGATGDKSYSLDVQGDWTAVQFTAEDRYLQLEYYDPALDTTANPRHYEFIWPGDYALTTSVINLKLSDKMVDIVTTPSFGAPQSEEDGYVFYQGLGGGMASGESLRVSLDYRLPDQGSSSGRQPYPSIAPPAIIVTTSAEAQSWGAWAIGALGAALIIWGGYRYRAAARMPKRSTSRRARPDGRSADKGKFCHNCGTAAQKGDRFCRSCGSQLR